MQKIVDHKYALITHCLHLAIGCFTINNTFSSYIYYNVKWLKISESTTTDISSHQDIYAVRENKHTEYFQ